jgi:uncharacterized protein (DUF2344 family)
MLKNWVYYMQRGLQSMWSKKPKGNKKYAIDLNDRTREKKINEKWTENALDLGRISAFSKVNKRNKEIAFEITDIEECGCLPDCGCKE